MHSVILRADTLLALSERNLMPAIWCGSSRDTSQNPAGFEGKVSNNQQIFIFPKEVVPNTFIDSFLLSPWLKYWSGREPEYSGKQTWTLKYSPCDSTLILGLDMRSSYLGDKGGWALVGLAAEVSSWKDVMWEISASWGQIECSSEGMQQNRERKKDGN